MIFSLFAISSVRLLFSITAKYLYEIEGPNRFYDFSRVKSGFGGSSVREASRSPRFEPRIKQFFETIWTAARDRTLLPTRH